MKIKCPYCDAMINDTLDICPHCGGPNPNVKRTANDTPKTIEELKQWYESHGLPPSEVTRFFIGVNYKKPRAFGIYKEENGKNFIVYKNKDNGERAIRYEGTDEAYAVNELYMRLKQEILEQKKHNQNKNKTSKASNHGSGQSITKNNESYSFWKNTLKPLLFMLVGAPIVFILICFIISAFSTEPQRGYYSYNNDGYYYFSLDEKWFDLNDEGNQWNEQPLSAVSIPEELKVKKTAKSYYLSFDWKDSINLPNFEESVYFIDRQNPATNGYYQYDGNNYYNLTGDYSYGWYSYSDDDWYPVEASDVPEDLKHYASSQDFYYTPVWDTSLNASNFTESAAYEKYEAEHQDDYSSSSDGYDWDSSDSWDSGGTDFSSDW